MQQDSRAHTDPGNDATMAEVRVPGANGFDEITTSLAGLEPCLESAHLDPAVHRTSARLKRACGDELGALAHSIAAQALEDHLAGSGAAMSICNVATGYFMKGEQESAARWYRLALSLDPNLAVAYQNLAAIHASAGRMAEAVSCRERAYRIQRVFIECADHPRRRVLILCTGRTSGNIPFEILLPTPTCCRIKYVIDYAAEQEDESLPPFDLVFNVIGEPDRALPLADRLERFARRCGRPVLNPPSAVVRSQRQRMAELLGDIDDVVAAPCARFDSPPASQAALVARLANAGLDLPVLARPEASHRGAGLARHESIEALAGELGVIAGSHYLTAFHDYRQADGYYRKYRIIFIDRQPYPCHLAISSHWMVHYFSAEMEKSPWKMQEEHRFMDNCGGALGTRAMVAIAAIGRRLDLDYAGIDFTLLPDGRVLVFEANATMLVHWERNNGQLAYKNTHVKRIVDAFERLMLVRTSA